MLRRSGTSPAILVWHLTGDPPDMAARATQLLATERDLLVTDLVAVVVLLDLRCHTAFLGLGSWSSSRR